MATVDVPPITLHGLPPSPPCFAIEAALRLKGLPYERIDLPYGEHGVKVAELYGEGRTTVPGLTIGDERIHGSTNITVRIDQLGDGPSLYPDPIADRVRDAELWAEGDLQLASRHLPWAAMHFRPEALGSYGGAGPLDPAGTDFAIKMIRGAWRYVGITAQSAAAQLQQLPELLDHVDRLIADGVLHGDTLNAADCQIGACVRSLTTIGDLQPLFDGRPAAELAHRVFPDWLGSVPAGAFPAGWVPTA